MPKIDQPSETTPLTGVSTATTHNHSAEPNSAHLTLNGLSLCFDLDGTLIDTAPDLIRVLNQVIAKEGLPATDYQAARRSVGYGAQRLILEACARAGHSVSDSRLKILRQNFLNLYADDIAQCSRPFPGVPQTLRALKQAGAHLSVCTNKPGYLARPLLDKLELRPLFDRIIGSGDGFARKPSAAAIFAAVGHRHPSRIVMIGDSLPDIAAAKAAGVPAIIMTYGYADMPVTCLRADHILHRFGDLPGTLAALAVPAPKIRQALSR